MKNEPTMPIVRRNYIVQLMLERQYCEVSQTPLVIEDTFLIHIFGSDEEFLVSGHGLRDLAIDPEDMEVISAETGMPVE